MASEELLSSITAYHHYVYDKLETILSACTNPLQRKKVQDLAFDVSRLLLKTHKVVITGQEGLVQPVTTKAQSAKVLLEEKMSRNEDIDSIITTMQSSSDDLWKITLQLPGDPVAKPPEED